MVRAMPAYWSEDKFDRYRNAWGQPGAITAMINWYRATFGSSETPRKSNTVQPHDFDHLGEKRSSSKLPDGSTEPGSLPGWQAGLL